MASPTLYPSYPPRLTGEQKAHLVSTCEEWALTQGLATRPAGSFTKSDHGGDLATTAPITLFPSLFPSSCFEEALLIQRAYNETYANIAKDEQWLGAVVAELAVIDDYIRKLWEIHEKVKSEGYAQSLSLGIFRSDYMVHLAPSSQEGSSKAELKQVEFNTIASSFGGLASRVSSLHKFLLQTEVYPPEICETVQASHLIDSASINRIAQGLAQAHIGYGAAKTGRLTCVLFIVQEHERNVFDQKHIEFALLHYNEVKSYRVSFEKVLDCTELGPDRTLIYSPSSFPGRSYEVTTIYFRAGYSPSEYPSERLWEARYHLERSAAVKCPSVLAHLAGTKKVQEILATPDSPHVQRFCPAADMADRLKGSFARMYPMDATSNAGKEGRRLATNPETAKQFVLKPQREGGGNNIYRSAIPDFLQSMPESQWPAYVLMEMIEPPAQENVVLRNGELQEGGVICELGMFGTCLWRNGDGEKDRGEMIHNKEAGYLLRTKGDTSEEGGVAAGFGAIDSVCLINI